MEAQASDKRGDSFTAPDGTVYVRDHLGVFVRQKDNKKSVAKK